MLRGTGDWHVTITNSNAPPQPEAGPGAGPGHERGTPQVAPKWGADRRDVTITDSNAHPRAGSGAGGEPPGRTRDAVSRAHSGPED
jgi:hypothetical protein